MLPEVERGEICSEPSSTGDKRLERLWELALKWDFQSDEQSADLMQEAILSFRAEVSIVYRCERDMLICEYVSGATGIRPKMQFPVEESFLKDCCADGKARFSTNSENRSFVKSFLAVPFRIEREDYYFAVFSTEQRAIYDENDLLFAQLFCQIVRRMIESLQHYARVTHMAFHDALTDLPNRAAIDARLQEALSAADRSHKLVGLLFLDINGFKSINDEFGHHTGDAILREVGRRMHAAMRRSEVAGRFGGDEFAVIFPDITDARELQDASTRLLQIFAIPFQVEDRSFEIRASIGIAVYPADGVESEDLIDNADAAMFRAKKSQTALCWYNRELQNELRHDAAAIDQLRTAPLCNELVLCYQPIRESASSSVRAVEAFIRWRHPTRGLLSPGAFLEVARRANRIHDIDEWTVSEVVREMAHWHASGFHSAAHINIAAPRIELISHALEAAAQSGIPPSSIVLEVAESLIASDPDEWIGFLTACRRAGLRTAIDRFEGQLPLSTFARCRVDYLKIDQAVMRNQTETADTQLGQVIKDLSGLREVKIILTGIEQPFEAAETLRANVFAEQGFGFERPLTSVDFRDLALSYSRSSAAANPNSSLT